MLEVIRDTVTDTLKLIPFLFLAYLAMEYLEHRTGEKTQRLIGKAGRLGPVLGGILGMAPQCGFSAAASNLYAGRVISLGTLIAVYLSTSDEMLPILISEQAPVGLMVRFLLTKAAIGLAAGMVVDLLFRKKDLAKQGTFTKSASRSIVTAKRELCVPRCGTRRRLLFLFCWSRLR